MSFSSKGACPIGFVAVSSLSTLHARILSYPAVGAPSANLVPLKQFGEKCDSRRILRSRAFAPADKWLSRVVSQRARGRLSVPTRSWLIGKNAKSMMACVQGDETSWQRENLRQWNPLREVTNVVR
jgi:hypothetical protein